MVRQISVYVNDWQYDELQDSENKSETVREALDLYFKNQKEEDEMIKKAEIIEGKMIWPVPAGTEVNSTKLTEWKNGKFEGENLERIRKQKKRAGEYRTYHYTDIRPLKTGDIFKITNTISDKLGDDETNYYKVIAKTNEQLKVKEVSQNTAKKELEVK